MNIYHLSVFELVKIKMFTVIRTKIALFLQAQIVVLTSQISWSESVEAALQAIIGQKNTADLNPLTNVLTAVESTLNVLADCVLKEQPPVRRRKLEHLVRNC